LAENGQSHHWARSRSLNYDRNTSPIVSRFCRVCRWAEDPFSNVGGYDHLNLSRKRSSVHGTGKFRVYCFRRLLRILYNVKETFFCQIFLGLVDERMLTAQLQRRWYCSGVLLASRNRDSCVCRTFYTGQRKWVYFVSTRPSAHGSNII
jgi:hypothetical protein